EILGDPPSPWMVGVLSEVGREVMRYFEEAVPSSASWEEHYAFAIGERAWMNFSAFFRLMDELGLPRTMVTEGVGGETENPLDARYDMRRLIRRLPTMLRMMGMNFAAIARTRRRLRELDRDLDATRTLLELQQANVRALDFSIRTNL